MNDKLSAQVRKLQWYAGILTLIVFALAVYVLKGNKPSTVDVLTAHRINIVEPDGTLKMVISNAAQQSPGTIDGKEIAPRPRPAGMIFFDDDGTECGGLVYDGDKKEASMTYSVDQYRNDQIMHLDYQEDSVDGRRVKSYGLRMWERPDDITLKYQFGLQDSINRLPDSAAKARAVANFRARRPVEERLFLGKSKEKEVGLVIRDAAGRVRIRIGIDSLGQVIWQKLDTAGLPILK